MNRPGVTLPELILVSWLFTLVLAAVAGFAGAQGRLVARAHDRVRAEEVLRTVDVVLGSELRAIGAQDITASSADSLRIRAVRGSGVICDAGAGEVVVRYRGVRLPEPHKDSVLLVRASAAPLALGLDDVASASTSASPSAPESPSDCDPRLRLTVSDDAALPTTGMALVFETGSYWVADGAVRYRRGAAGRQPITEEVLSDGDLHHSAGRLLVRLHFRPEALPRLGDKGATSLSFRLASP